MAESNGEYLVGELFVPYPTHLFLALYVPDWFKNVFLSVYVFLNPFRKPHLQVVLDWIMRVGDTKVNLASVPSVYDWKYHQ